jgi:hypothetical protein
MEDNPTTHTRPKRGDESQTEYLLRIISEEAIRNERDAVVAHLNHQGDFLRERGFYGPAVTLYDAAYAIEKGGHRTIHDFYEEDEPVADVVAAFDAGDVVVVATAEARAAASRSRGLIDHTTDVGRPMMHLPELADECWRCWQKRAEAAEKALGDRRD